MFMLVEMSDVVRVPPAQFDLSLSEAISDVLNRKLANKVVYSAGLCLTLFDITSMGECFLLPGDGASHTKVKFRFVVFRPFVKEIVVGRIKSCSRDGVYVTLGFFDDIFIPAMKLQHPSRFNESEQKWAWEYVSEDNTKHDLFMEKGAQIRFRVIDEAFEDIAPNVADSSDIGAATEEKKVPYLVMGSINETGLGLLSWWT